jgi:hypothetical protein
MTEPVFHESRASIGHEPGRTPERLVVVGLVLLLVLVIKPWGQTPEPATGPGPAVHVAATPEILTFSDLPCSGHMWLIEADTRWAGQTVRSWMLTDAVEATGPTDPSIRFVVVAAQQVLSVGYCPPYHDDQRPHSNLAIFRLQPTVQLVQTRTVRVEREAEASANDLLAPVPVPVASGQARGIPGWQPGRYVMHVEGPVGYERWLGFEIRLISSGMGSLASPSAPTPGAPTAAP